MIATTIINSIRVKPFCTLRATERRFIHYSREVAGEKSGHRPGALSFSIQRAKVFGSLAEPSL